MKTIHFIVPNTHTSTVCFCVESASEYIWDSLHYKPTITIHLYCSQHHFYESFIAINKNYICNAVIKTRFAKIISHHSKCNTLSVVLLSFVLCAMRQFWFIPFVHKSWNHNAKFSYSFSSISVTPFYLSLHNKRNIRWNGPYFLLQQILSSHVGISWADFHIFLLWNFLLGTYRIKG